MRFFIELSYKGTDYHGWQVQPNAPSVQSEINKALSTIFNTKIEVTGAGRTDTGVHAKQMFAHFDFLEEFEKEQISSKLNGVLPKDIAIHNIYKVNENANCRFDAISRTYHYHIVQQKNLFKHLCNLKKKRGTLIMLEFRTDKDPLINKGKKLSKNETFTNHYRRFINVKDILKYFNILSFKIIYILEKKGLSKYKNDNPVLCRLILKIEIL